MAKMTISGLKTFTQTYVDKAKQAGAWVASADNLLGLQNKVGMQITLDGSFQDKLPELDGNDLPLGKTIEEYFIDLQLPSDYDETGADTMAPAYPTVEDASYCYTLGRKKIKTTEPYDNVERAALTAEGAANMISKIRERLANSYSLYTYAQKKQLLGNFADKACAVGGGLSQVVAIPSNTETSEAFIKQVKNDVEAASFASEGTSLSGALIGAAPRLTLYIKKGIMPTIEVEALAGAFHAENLALPADVKVVDDFGKAGTNNANVYAMLVDPRGVKLHRGYHRVRSQENADGDFINFVDHNENTGFISKFTFVKCYKSE